MCYHVLSTGEEGRAVITLGIDPGLATVGFGVVGSDVRGHRAIEYGTVLTKPGLLLEERLELIYDGVYQLAVRHSPDAAAVEELFSAETSLPE